MGVGKKQVKVILQGKGLGEENGEGDRCATELKS